ncbi:MAG: long-chain fatty acid--CoA ligase [Promethearchaeati archaeon SRVP18_Atabeyarchaeia-1]
MSKQSVYDKKPWLKSYSEGIPAHIEYPEVQMFEIIEKGAREIPDQPAIYFFGKKITYRELKNLTERLATAFADLGVKKGDVVALHLPNYPQFIIGYFAALRIGALVTSLSLLATAPEARYQLSDTGAETIVLDERYMPIFQQIRAETKIKRVILTSLQDFLPGRPPVHKEIPGAHWLLDLLNKYQPNPPKVKINPKEDPAVLQYTGGTTGVPKGAILTHYNLYSNAVQTMTWYKILIYGKEINMANLPLFHLFGQELAMNMGLYSGSMIVLNPDPRDIASLLNLIKTTKPTIMAGVPTLFMKIVDHPDVTSKKVDFGCFKVCGSGAAPCPPELIKKFGSITKASLIEGYGMTETSPVVTLTPMSKDAKIKIGSVGLPVPDTEVRLVDIDTGTKEVPLGEPGEIVVRGPQVFKGYWNKPEETKNQLKNGWLYTGDIAKMDEDGYFYIVDRKKEMVIVSGYKVYPREVDDVLYEHPAVQMAATVGIPDPEKPGSEKVKAFIVLKPGYSPSEELKEEIIRHARKSLAPYKVPKFIEFRNEVPTSLVGKVLKRPLKEEEQRKIKK